MRVPWIVYAGAASHALPILAVAAWRRRLTHARKWVIAWCAFQVASEIVTLLLSRQNSNNHWMTYLNAPVAAAMALWALSLWQTSPVAALSLRLTVPLLGFTWLAMILLVENTQTFSLLAEPFAGLLVLGGAVFTLVSNTFRETTNVLEQDWLWIGLGLALYSGAAVALPPTAHWLITTHPELVVKAYEVKAVFLIVALLAIARGVTCPTPERSGGSLSRGSSPSPSSSSASSSPW